MATTSQSATSRRALELAYGSLLLRYGRQHWWPADTPFEVCIGAILTQSTSWTNVERAIGNLKAAGLLSPEGIGGTPKERLSALIRPSLYHNVKARKLHEFVAFLGRYGSVQDMRARPLPELRDELLEVWGIGPETADSILLYALGKPTFVVDAYTRRVVSRLGLLAEDATYQQMKAFFESNLPRSAPRYNEYHALIVRHGKDVCKTKPRCGECCLRAMCKAAKAYKCPGENQ
jgi:endonuclease III related protein